MFLFPKEIALFENNEDGHMRICFVYGSFFSFHVDKFKHKHGKNNSSGNSIKIR